MKTKHFYPLILFLFFLLSGHLYSQSLIWQDEFEYTGLPDNAKWGYDVMPPGTVNNELQNYTENRLENARVENGNLIIEARMDNYQGHPYSSARLVTRGKGDWLYGRVETKAILPAGRGTWPAIWMLPTDWVYGGWPHSGEIDIMEHVGYDQGVVHASTHSLDYYWQNNNQKTATINVPDCSENYHVYAMEWSPSKIDVYVDDILYFTSVNENAGWTAWPFDQRFHLLLNIAIGGDWGGQRGVDNKIFPVRMTVDYVRVYSYNAPADTEAPTVPTALSAKASSSSLALSWTASRDNYSVKEYEVYNGETLVGTTIFPNYTLTGLTPLTTYNVKVRAKDHSGNLSAFATGSFATTEIVVINIPSKIEAENYDAQFGVQTEATTDEGGGINVGWIDQGDWMEYVVGVSAAGEFAVDYRAASLNGGGQVQLITEGGQVLSSTDIPASGGWQNWVTVSSGSFQLPAGNSRIRVYASSGGFNLNWLEFKSASSSGDTTPPSAPTNLASTGKTGTTVSLSWNPSTDNVGVIGYNVYVGGVLRESTSSTSITVTGLSNNSRYTFTVRARDAAGNLSAASNSVNVRTNRTGARENLSAESGQSIGITSLYPNPSSEKLYVEYFSAFAGEVELSLKNPLGSAMFNKHVNAVKGKNLVVFDVSALKKGVYFVAVKNKKESFVKRILVER